MYHRVQASENLTKDVYRLPVNCHSTSLLSVVSCLLACSSAIPSLQQTLLWVWTSLMTTTTRILTTVVVLVTRCPALGVSLSSPFTTLIYQKSNTSLSRCLQTPPLQRGNCCTIWWVHRSELLWNTFLCSELLAGALAKLGRDVYTVCEDITDREDEDQLNEHFQLVLAKQSAGQFKCLRPLRATDNIFPYFIGSTDNSLFITLKRSVTAPMPGTSTNPLIPH